MGIKVTYNSCFGGFSISKKCAERMSTLGSAEADLILEEHTKHGDDHWYGGWRGDRHDPVLVKAVLELGCYDASGDCAELHVVELEGDRYIIREYDGREYIVEPRDINWVVVQPAEK